MSDKDQHEQSMVNAIEKVKTLTPTYYTREMRSSYMQRYVQIPGMQPAILRTMHQFLTGDGSAPNDKIQSEVDKRLCDFLLLADDPDLVFDLRKHNGKPHNKDFDQFWEELGKYLDEHSQVNDRRHGTHMYMPFAMYVEDLVQLIAARLPADSKLPSVTLVRFISEVWHSTIHGRLFLYLNTYAYDRSYA